MQVEDVLRELVARRLKGGERLIDLMAMGMPIPAALQVRRLPGTEAASNTSVDAAVLADRVRVARGSWDLMVAVLSLAGSLVMTLSEKYYGHSFGTFADYAAVFGLAFGITTGVSVLASGLATLQFAGVPRILRR
jgi:hypothetical protein